jgi:hypothetical protein
MMRSAQVVCPAIGHGTGVSGAHYFYTEHIPIPVVTPVHVMLDSLAHLQPGCMHAF